MAWEEEQERLMRPGYLQHLPPDGVFNALRQLSSKVTLVDSPYSDIEPLLLERNEPLIDLALAAYGTNKDVYVELYQRALEPPATEVDEHRMRSVRVACLANQVLSTANFVFQFPQDILGDDEVFRVLSTGAKDELEALVSNPTFSPKLLEAIFSLQPPMPDLPDERQRSIIYLAAKNPRIGIKEEHHDSPDMEHYYIHQGIFTLLEVAPVDLAWYWVVDYVITRVDPNQAHAPQRVDHVLQRWRGLHFPTSRSDETEQEGNYTDLTRVEELVCYIAALYGRVYNDKKSTIVGNANSKDVALRCAYYANASLSLKEMKAGMDRDGKTYLLGACFNSNIMTNRALKKYFEEEQLSGEFQPLYSKFLKFAHKRYPYIKEATVEWLREEGKPAADPALEQVQTTLAQVKEQLDKFQANAQSVAIWGMIVLAVYALSSWWKG